MSVTRRRLLSFGLGGAAMLAAGGVWSWFRGGYSVPPGDVPVALTVKELAIVRAIVEALHPADGDLPSGLSIGVHLRIDEEVWSANDHARADLKAAIGVLEHVPLLFGWGGRLTHLPPADRVAFLVEVMATGPGPIGRAATAIKQLCSLFYYSHPATWAAIGYDGPWVPESPPDSSVRYAEHARAAREAR